MSTKEEILKLLDATDREGIDEVMDWMNQSDFFVAPASTNFHGNYEGGLAEHSINVYTAAMRLRATAVSLNPSLEERLPQDSIAIATLLHDICKADVYKETKKKRQNRFSFLFTGLERFYVSPRLDTAVSDFSPSHSLFP